MKKGTKVGELILNYDSKEYKYDLVVNEDVKKASYFKVLVNNLKDIVTGNIRKKWWLICHHFQY